MSDHIYIKTVQCWCTSISMQHWQTTKYPLFWPGFSRQAQLYDFS